jgi:hypothetical protein
VHWRAALLVILPLAALLGQFVFAYPVPRSPPVLAWLLGMVVGALSWSWSARLADRAWLLAVVLAAGLVSLLPWQWSATGGAFHLVPLDAVLSAAQRTPHSLALMWDLFWVAAFFTLARHLGWPRTRVALVLTGLLLLREWVQRWMPHQQADVTPVLLPLLLWGLMHRRLGSDLTQNAASVRPDSGSSA